MTEVFEITKEYGLGAALGSIILPWAYILDRRSRRNSLDIKNVHSGCHLPMGSVEKIQVEVKDLQETDANMKAQFVAVSKDLERLERIESKMDTVLMHLTKKGMDA